MALLMFSSVYNSISFTLQAFHTIAEAMNAMSNILLRQFPSFSDHLIETTNYPLPNTAKNKVNNNVINRFSNDDNNKWT